MYHDQRGHFEISNDRASRVGFARRARLQILRLMQNGSKSLDFSNRRPPARPLPHEVVHRRRKSQIAVRFICVESFVLDFVPILLTRVHFEQCSMSSKLALLVKVTFLLVC